eukprot:GHUV01036323.1.p2 GENE.GHUV01036323.1~~GHUV01036323.1.p2  ORF type:complete len:174 (-),score=55.52 GHUV01036323.1:308-829(-)
MANGHCAAQATVLSGSTPADAVLQQVRFLENITAVCSQLLMLLYCSLVCREQFFEKEIATIRERELKLQFRNAVIKTVNLAMVFGTPPMTACVIFASYEVMVGRLSATLAFTTLSLFNILRFPLVVLPKAMRALSEALASIQRVEAFLLEDVPTDAEGVTKSTAAGVKIVSTA